MDLCSASLSAKKIFYAGKLPSEVRLRIINHLLFADKALHPRPNPMNNFPLSLGWADFASE